MKSYQILIIIMSLSLLGLGYWWFINNFKLVTKEAEIGYRGEARYNPFLAAQHLVEKMGATAITARSFSKLHRQLAPQDTLVLALYSDELLTDSRREWLWEWIVAGGHLIAFKGPQSDYLHLWGNQQEEDEAEPGYIEQEFGISEQYNDQLLEAEIEATDPLELTWDGYDVVVYFNPAYYLIIENNAHASGFGAPDRDGYHFLHAEYGAGSVTLLSDAIALQNSRIGEHDHAQYFWQLINMHHQPETVWFWRAYTGDFPSVLQLLWQYAWTVVITGGLLLLVWLRAISQRFGAILPMPLPARRRLLEHIEASGDFLWRRKQSTVLLKSTRQTLWQRLEVVHPDWLHLAEADLVQRFVLLTELPEQQIDQALHRQPITSQLEFTRAIHTLTQLKDAL